MKTTPLPELTPVLKQLRLSGSSSCIIPALLYTIKSLHVCESNLPQIVPSGGSSESSKYESDPEKFSGKSATHLPCPLTDGYMMPS